MWGVRTSRRETLVVDADDLHGGQVCASIQSYVDDARPRAFDRASEAVRCIANTNDLDIDVVFVDTALPEHGALAVIDAVFRMRSSPVVIAMGRGTDATTDVFELAKAGVHAYLPKPLSEEQVHACLGSSSSSLDPIRHL